MADGPYPVLLVGRQATGHLDLGEGLGSIGALRRYGFVAAVAPGLPVAVHGGGES